MGKRVFSKFPGRAAVDIDWIPISKVAFRIWVALAIGLALAYAGDRYWQWLEREKEISQIQGKSTSGIALISLLGIVLLILAVIDVIDPFDFLIILLVFYLYFKPVTVRIGKILNDVASRIGRSISRKRIR